MRFAIASGANQTIVSPDSMHFPFARASSVPAFLFHYGGLFPPLRENCNSQLAALAESRWNTIGHRNMIAFFEVSRERKHCGARARARARSMTHRVSTLFPPTTVSQIALPRAYGILSRYIFAKARRIRLSNRFRTKHPLLCAVFLERELHSP